MSGVRIILRNPPGGDLIELGTQYLYRGGWEVVQNAEEGSGGRSTLLLDDPDLSLWEWLGLNVGGRQQIRLVDIDSGKIVHFGFTGKRGIRRKYDDKGHPAGRAWSVDIWDTNSILQRRILHHNAARRPRESDVDRIMALLDMPEWGIISQVIIGPSETTMSKHDYRGMSVGQYIGDCAQTARKNWWADIVDIGDGDHQTFWYGRDSRSAYASTLSISNDPDDFLGSSTVFAPAKDTEYTMDPERVFDGIWASGEKTSIYRHRAATSEVLGLRWDTANTWPTVHEKDRLIAKAESMLERLKDEQEVITTAIEVPSTSAHLVRAGMRIPMKLTHVEALASFTDCRILSRGLQPISDGARYRIPLTLEPIGPSDVAPSCSTSVAAAQSADESDHPDSAVSISITPEAGNDYVIFGNAVALWGPTNMTATGANTQLYTHGTATIDHPTLSHMYRAISGASGSYNVTATYGGDPGHWGAVAMAIQTSATTPVQDESGYGFSQTVTLSTPPTPGNLMVMQITVRDDTEITDVTPTGYWTKQVEAFALFEIANDSTAIFTHCVTADEEYVTFGGAGATCGVTVTEWEIT